MTRYNLRRKIELKFGSYANFARLIGVHELRGKTPAQIDRLASELLRKESGGIVPRKLELLKSKILASGGVSEFCEKNGFSQVTVHQILQGRRKRMSPIVTRLFKHFGI